MHTSNKAPNYLIFDKYAYNTIKVGDQYWMTDNFKCTHDSDGNPIDWYCYNDNVENIDKYGRLYSWEVAANSAPAGWRLPTDEDWNNLEIAVGMDESQVNLEGWRGTDEAFKLMQGQYIRFNALLSGYYRYSEQIYKGLNVHSSFWTSTPYNNLQAWGREMFNDNGQISRREHPKNFGFSVRYVKDI